KVPMEIEYTLKFNYDNTVWLEWRTGIDHRYVVKNIRDFLDHVLYGEAHFFTKKFTYHPSEHYFFKQDMEIFKLLSSFIATGDVFTDKGYFFNTSYDKRTILIPPIGFQQLMTLLENRPITVETTETTYDGFQLFEDMMPYYFTVDQGEGKGFLLKVEGKEG